MGNHRYVFSTHSNFQNTSNNFQPIEFIGLFNSKQGHKMMNFELVGMVFQATGTVATILTIVYLANQIRLSNKLAVSSIEHKLNTRVYERRFITARDTDFCEFLSRNWDNDDLSKSEKVKISQYITMLIIDAREVYLQDKLGFVTEGVLKARIDVLKLGIMKNSISKGVWQTYKNLVETDFASYFENEIYPEGFADIPATFHPLAKSEDHLGAIPPKPKS